METQKTLNSQSSLVGKKLPGTLKGKKKQPEETNQASENLELSELEFKTTISNMPKDLLKKLTT